jgi:hypothetical protein
VFAAGKAVCQDIYAYIKADYAFVSGGDGLMTQEGLFLYTHNNRSIYGIFQTHCVTGPASIETFLHNAPLNSPQLTPES